MIITEVERRILPSGFPFSHLTIAAADAGDPSTSSGQSFVDTK